MYKKQKMYFFVFFVILLFMLCFLEKLFRYILNFMKVANKQEIISASLLINQLTDEDVEKRKAAVLSLKSIGQALGPTRIKSQLIPHLRQQIVNDDDNKVILAMLDSLSSLGQIMGGGVQYANLFPIVEDVMQNQQQQVRVKAVETFEKLIRQGNAQKCQAKIISSLKNILAFQYHQAKQAFAAVAAKMLGDFSNPNQQMLLAQYLSFAESQIFSLRKFASMYSKYLVQWLADFEAPILKIVQILFKDKDQSNKIYLVDTIISLSKFKNHAFLQAYFNIISYQFPWRVRYELISKVDKLAQVLGTAEKFKAFLPYMVKYINDIEPQIRSISCLKLKEIVGYVDGDDVVTRIIPALKSIPQDTHIYVRNSLAKSLLSFCSLVGKKNTSEHILPKFLQLLKDEEIQVRLTIFGEINLICDVLGVDTLAQTTVPAILQLAQHPKWRVRAQSIDFLFYLIKKSGKQFMSQKIIKQVMDYLRDKANAVRKQAIKLMSKIQIQFGSQWFQKNMMAKILQCSKATSYIQRQVFLQTIQILFPYTTYEFMSKNISPILHTSMLTDPVENVRLTLCKVFKTVYEICPKDKDIARKSLRVLSEDKDRDVREAATKILKQLS